MKKGRGKSRKLPMAHMAVGFGVALIATGWYWSDLRAFYTETAQAAAALLGFSSM